MQDGYYAASPQNLVRVILGKEHASDHTGENRYTRAARSFQDWRKQRIFLQDAQPSLYLYVLSRASLRAFAPSNRSKPDSVPSHRYPPRLLT